MMLMKLIDHVNAFAKQRCSVFFQVFHKMGQCDFRSFWRQVTWLLWFAYYLVRKAIDIVEDKLGVNQNRPGQLNLSLDYGKVVIALVAHSKMLIRFE